MAAIPFAAQAETINIYGWQNHSWEFIDIDGGRSFDRTQSNAGNIGFAASMDTGLNGIKVNFQCEQFTFYNHFGGFGDWCNRNSKIGLAHPQAGEIMMATWLLPYNEGVAQWVDPFYDAGADSHTSIMGSVGASGTFYNAGFGFAGAAAQSFNRRQENIIQYWSPNWNGFVFRFAWTVGNRDETTLAGIGTEVDPVIRSSSLAYTNGPLWLAVTWQDHEDWAAAALTDAGSNAVMHSSDAESMRIAGRYIMDMGDGISVQVSAMWESVEYEFNNVTNVDAAMSAFGYANFLDSYALMDGENEIMGTAAVPAVPAVPAVRAKFAEADNMDDLVKMKKTLAEIHDIFSGNAASDGTNTITLSANYTYDDAGTPDDTSDDSVLDAADYALPALQKEVMDDPLTVPSEAKTSNEMVSIADYDEEYDTTLAADAEGYDATKATAAAMRNFLLAAQGEGNPADDATTGYKYKDAYDALVASATAMAKSDFDMDDANITTPEVPEVPAVPAVSKADRRASIAVNQNVKIERDAWMVSGKVKFGGPVDFRFSYMDADDLEVSCSHCSGDWNDTAAEAFNIGMFYTMPAGTELRLTYSEVDNDTNGTYDFGIGTLGTTAGQDIEMFAVGIVHWFD